MISTATDTTNATCSCGDADVELLRRLIAAGYTQAAASHLLWGDPTRVGPPPVGVDVGLHARLFVRRCFATAFPSLRLPRPHRKEAC